MDGIYAIPRISIKLVFKSEIKSHLDLLLACNHGKNGKTPPYCHSCMLNYTVQHSKGFAEWHGTGISILF
jgi:hypothetical protein